MSQSAKPCQKSPNKMVRKNGINKKYLEFSQKSVPSLNFEVPALSTVIDLAEKPQSHVKFEAL